MTSASSLFSEPVRQLKSAKKNGDAPFRSVGGRRDIGVIDEGVWPK